MGCFHGYSANLPKYCDQDHHLIRNDDLLLLAGHRSKPEQRQGAEMLTSAKARLYGKESPVFESRLARRQLHPGSQHCTVQRQTKKHRYISVYFPKCVCLRGTSCAKLVLAVCNKLGRAEVPKSKLRRKDGGSGNGSSCKAPDLQQLPALSPTHRNAPQCSQISSIGPKSKRTALQIPVTGKNAAGNSGS